MTNWNIFVAKWNELEIVILQFKKKKLTRDKMSCYEIISQVLRKHVLGSSPTGGKQCEFLFRRVSKEIKADENGRVKELM